METRLLPPPYTKETGSWTSDTTYHSLYEDDDVKKNFIPLGGGDDDKEELGGTREQPKIALRKRFSWLHPLVHLLPVGATLGILQLSFREVYWDDDGRYDVRWQAVLQFPAKLHEILIVGSLSAIVLHIFRRMLVSQNGIPLGLMVGAFQMGSAEYLISKSFVKPFRHSLTHRRYKTFFVALALGLAILYSFLVGPASAGALIPVLDWWEMHEPFNGSLPLTSYMSRSRSELYPMTLGKESINPECLEKDDWDYIGCPAEGWGVLNDWAWTRVQESFLYNVTEGHYYDPTMESSFSGQAQREIITRLVASDNSSTAAAIAATLHSSAQALIDSFWHFVDGNVVGKINKAKHTKLIVSRGTPVSIPLVQVQCTAYDFGAARVGYSTGDPLTFETGAMVGDFSKSGSNPYSSATWVVPDGAWNFTRPQDAWGTTNITWVDASGIRGTQGESLYASLAAVVTVPGAFRSSFPNGTRNAGQGSKTAPCLIDARWATTDVMFDTAGDVVETALTDWLASADLLGGNVNVKAALSGWEVSEPISLSTEWARLINSPVRVTAPDSLFSGLPLTEYILQQFVSVVTNTTIRDFYPSTGQTTYRDTAHEIAMVLGSVVADWMARSTFRDTLFTTVISAEKEGNVSTVDLLHQRSRVHKYGTTPVSALQDQTPVAFRVRRQGYGYGLNSDTIWFSLVILLIHVLVVLVYFAYSFVFWCRARGWTSNSWGTIGEFVALAALSPPADELRNSGAGINRSRTWMTRLRIREGSSDPERLELVIGSRHGTVIPTDNMVKLDKEYA
ncbi:hypothetical protein F4802DRAFT_340419 [Xylaria palmicola]|nr:hypothetical protein F4802DRAFT_340419 [Xylaria palmicola]